MQEESSDDDLPLAALLSKAFKRQDIGCNAEQPAHQPDQLDGQVSGKAGGAPVPQPADMHTDAQAVPGAAAVAEGIDDLLVPDSEEDLL